MKRKLEKIQLSHNNYYIEVEEQLNYNSIIFMSQIYKEEFQRRIFILKK